MFIAFVMAVIINTTVEIDFYMFLVRELAGMGELIWRIVKLMHN